MAVAKDAASFLQLTREDPVVRQALDTALLAEALDSTEAEQSLLEVSVKIAKQQGFDFDTADLRQALEADLGLEEIVLVSDEFGDEETVDAAGGGSCKTRTGCRTPCRYCNAVDDPGGFEEPIFLPE